MKACRNQVCIYAVIKAPEELYLLDKDDDAAESFSPLPKEFADFQDCLATAQTINLPLKGAPEHAIDLLPGSTPLYRPIYPLLPKELTVL